MKVPRDITKRFEAVKQRLDPEPSDNTDLEELLDFALLLEDTKNLEKVDDYFMSFVMKGDRYFQSCKEAYRQGNLDDWLKKNPLAAVSAKHEEGLARKKVMREQEKMFNYLENLGVTHKDVFENRAKYEALYHNRVRD